MLIMGLRLPVRLSRMPTRKLQLCSYKLAPGIAWFHQKHKDLLPSKITDISSISDWPGTGDVNDRGDPKVPSVISYSRTPKKCKQWGFSIDEDSTTLSWTKLELRPQPAAKELAALQELLKGLPLLHDLMKSEDLDMQIPRQIIRNPQGVVRDYLGNVAGYWRDYITKETRHVLDAVPLDIVITHPAVCIPFDAHMAHQ